MVSDNMAVCPLSLISGEAKRCNPLCKFHYGSDGCLLVDAVKAVKAQLPDKKEK